MQRESERSERTLRRSPRKSDDGRRRKSGNSKRKRGWRKRSQERSARRASSGRFQPSLHVSSVQCNEQAAREEQEWNESVTSGVRTAAGRKYEDEALRCCLRSLASSHSQAPSASEKPSNDSCPPPDSVTFSLLPCASDL
eukprot:767894-Hanusia_phi.AAC.2